MKYRQGDRPIQGYQLIRILGRGGFGVVWLAEGPGGVRVALKIIDLTRGRGQKELRAIGRVKSIVHPNLVPIQGLWLTDHHGRVLDEDERESVESSLKTKVISKNHETVTDDSSEAETDGPDELIIAMGLCEKSLLDRLAECQSDGMAGIPASELIGYMQDAARGIDYLNSKSHDLGLGDVGIQHGDIKPGNLMIVGGAVQVCDFGLARVLRDSRSTTIAYTPAYAAPETITLNKPSVATDQYSLAVSYLELRCGRLPFESESAYLIAKVHTEGQLDLSALPQPEREVIAKAASVQPCNRYRSATKMVDALRGAIVGAKEFFPLPSSEFAEEVLTDIAGTPSTNWGEAPTQSELPATVTQATPPLPQQVTGAQQVTRQEANSRSPNRLRIAIGLTLLIGIAIGLFLAGSQGNRPEPPPPLPPRSDGEPYDSEDLHQQFLAIRDILGDGAELDEVLSQLDRRFSELKVEDFDDSLEPQQRTDLREIQSLLQFFGAQPTVEEADRWAQRIQTRGAGPRLSGMVRDFLVDLLHLQIEQLQESTGERDSADE